MLGLSNAPPKSAASAHCPAPEKAQLATPHQQPLTASPLKSEESPLRNIPVIAVSQPKREALTVEYITALLARLTLAPVQAAKQISNQDEDDDLLSATPWAYEARRGTSQDMNDDDDDEVAEMLDELVDGMCA